MFPLFEMKVSPTSAAIFVKTVEIYFILIYFVVEDDTTVDGTALFSLISSHHLS